MKRKVLLLFLIGAICTLILPVLSACSFLPHDHDLELVETKAATCTEDGQETYKCSICGEIRYKILYKYGHDWNQLQYTAPTCTEQGYSKIQCNRCKKIEENNLEMVPHKVDPEEQGKDPTCTEDGYEPAGTCNVCHQHIDRKKISALGHNYSDGVCAVCGEREILTVVYHSQPYGGETVTKTFAYGELFDTSVQFSNTSPDQLIVGWYHLEIYSHTLFEQYTEETQITSNVNVCAKWMENRAVSTPEQLFAIKDNPDIAYHLTQNINLGGKAWTPIQDFSGIFDGDGHTIRDFQITDSAAGSSYAMFVNNCGTIKNLVLRDVIYNVTFKGSASAKQGLLVAQNEGDLINCHINEGRIQFTAENMNTQESYHFGTIAALNRGTVENCSCTVDITCDLNAGYDNGANDRYEHRYTADFYIGGLIGLNENEVSDSHYDGRLSVTNIYTYGLVMSTMYGYLTTHYLTANFYFGGLIGAQSGGTVTQSYANFAYLHDKSSKIKYAYGGDDGIVSYEYSWVGGLIGLNTNNGQISSCFAYGDISDKSSDGSTVGGLVAANYSNATVTSCHSSAEVMSVSEKSNVVGGLVGANGASVQNCYASGAVHGGKNSNTGGFVGLNTQQGTMSKCYSTGNVYAESGNADFFVGNSEGGDYKCYYLQGATVQCNGVYLVTAKKGEPKPYSKLWTDEFLIDELYWNESGWIIVLNGDPMLEWEKDVGHSYKTNVVKPTCEDFGYTVYTCTDCGRMFIRDYVAPNGHQQSREVSRRDAACEQTGAIIYHCDVCGKDYEVETDPAKEHIPTIKKGDERVEPSCKMENGIVKATPGHTEKWTCELCEKVLQEPQTIEPHKFHVDEQNSQKPDCITEGKTHLVCELCGFEKDEIVPATGHTLEAGSLNCTVCEQPVWDEDTFIKVSNLTALKAIADDLNGRYMLTADIDLQGERWTPIGTQENPFAGVFYGNGYSIKNLTLTDVTAGGLFGCNIGEIVKLTVENANLSITDTVDSVLGVIAAVNKSTGKIFDCKVTGQVKFDVSVNKTTTSFNDNSTSHYVTIGGIVARNEESGSIDKCVVDATIGVSVVNTFTNSAEVDLSFYLNRGWKQGVSKFNEGATIGGIVGFNGGSVTNCTMSGSLNVDVTQQIYIERVVNEGKWTEVRYKAGKMELTTNVYEGSLVGNNKGSIADCRAHGSALNRLGGTQDDSSSLFAMTHNLNRISNTDESVCELVGYSDGTCTGVQKLA